MKGPWCGTGTQTVRYDIISTCAREQQPQCNVLVITGSSTCPRTDNILTLGMTKVKRAYWQHYNTCKSLMRIEYTRMKFYIHIHVHVFAPVQLYQKATVEFFHEMQHNTRTHQTHCRRESARVFHVSSARSARRRRSSGAGRPPRGAPPPLARQTASSAALKPC